MEIIALGTGNAMSLHYYNTCFALREGGRALLVDAGGGNGILKRLADARIPLPAIHDMILTHAHCDHLLGAVWIVRKFATLMREGKYEGVFSIYCHESVRAALMHMCEATLQKKFTSLLGERIVFRPVTDGAQYEILSLPFTFFDIGSTKLLQFGFTWRLPDGRKATCLGDEPYNPACERYVRGSDWLLCEAFCLYGDREIFRPYEKHHSTVREACALAQSLGVPHLVVWHTEDKTFPERKARYTREGAQFYSHDLRVPDDLETLTL